MKILWEMIFDDSSWEEEEEYDDFELEVVVVSIQEDFLWRRLGSRFGRRTLL